MPANYSIETSLTLGYRREAWGIERIVLDSVANHMPEDSGGSIISVKVKQEGKYLDFRAIDHSKKVEQVMIRDNGNGYDAELLSVLYSTKHGSLAVGRFGEGLKMVAAAALRHGVNIEYRSRGWSAFPYTKPEIINGMEIKRLCFLVNKAEPICGSRTIFHNPSPELIQEVLNLPKKALMFNSTYRVLSAEQDAPDIKYASRIIEGGDVNYLYVKGFRVAEIPAVFSYDMGIDNISPDRKLADTNIMLDEIEHLLRTCTEPKVIEAALRAADKDSVSYSKARYEFMALDRNRHASRRFLESCLAGVEDKNRKKSSLEFASEVAWASAFKKLFGEKAVIADAWNSRENADAELYGFKAVRLNEAVAKFMSDAGIKLASSVANLNERLYKWVKEEELTAEERALLAMVPRIYQLVTGSTAQVECQVYSGVFLPNGREVEGQAAISGVSEDGKQWMALHRQGLKDRREFVQSCVHESGHLASGKLDYDRDFTEYFVIKLAEILGREL